MQKFLTPQRLITYSTWMHGIHPPCLTFSQTRYSTNRAAHKCANCAYFTTLPKTSSCENVELHNLTCYQNVNVTKQ